MVLNMKYSNTKNFDYIHFIIFLLIQKTYFKILKINNLIKLIF